MRICACEVKIQKSRAPARNVMRNNFTMQLVFAAKILWQYDDHITEI
jgi:hypothetical protein